MAVDFIIALSGTQKKKMFKRHSKKVLSEPTNLSKLLNLDPYNSNERSLYDNNMVRETILQNPSAARSKVAFREGRGDVHPFFMAVSLDASPDVVQLLYNAYPSAVAEVDEGKRTPLHAACKTGASSEVVRLLASWHPPSLRWKDRGQSTPLHEACKSTRWNVDVVRLLVDLYPPALEEVDYTGWAPLHLGCVRRAPVEEIRLLLDHSPRVVEVKDMYGRTPAHLAARFRCSVEVLSLLVRRYPAALRLRDERGHTPLVMAEHFNGSAEVVTLLRTFEMLWFCDPSDEKMLKILADEQESAGRKWTSLVAPILSVRGSVVHKLGLDEGVMTTLLGRVAGGGDCGLGTIWELLRGRPEIVRWGAIGSARIHTAKGRPSV